MSFPSDKSFMFHYTLGWVVSYYSESIICHSGIDARCPSHGNTDMPESASLEVKSLLAVTSLDSSRSSSRQDGLFEGFTLGLFGRDS